MRGVLAAVAAIFLTASCAAAQPAAESPTLGVFEGVLPCADCPGVRTELTLRRKGQGWAEGPYVLKQARIGGPGETAAEGEWTTQRGDAADPDAVVYQLDPDRPEQSRYFVKSGEDLIRALDRDLKPAPGELRRKR